MPVESGIGASLSWDNGAGTPQAIGPDVGDVSFEQTRADLQVPGLANTAMSRVSGLVDMQISAANGYFNDATDRWFDVVKTIGSSLLNRTVAFALSGQTFTNEVQMLSVKFNRTRDGGMALEASAALADGVNPAWTP